MALLKIARMGHPVLLQRAAPVADPTHPDIRRLVADMFETMGDAGGVGLAAPQVHAPLRLFVYAIPAVRAGGEPTDSSVEAGAVINPEIEPLGEERVAGWEGCLSIPGMRGVVPRAARIRLRGVDAEGQPIDRELAGFRAIVAQHEFDHLNGVLYPMRMTDFAQFGFVEELARAAQAAQPGGAA
jgi:peptide deformylase